MTALDAQVVIMGRGDEHYEQALEEAASRHAGAVAYHATSEEALARQVYAGSDFFLAPSTFEPCGLGPLIALRYGSIPAFTGGLAETIRITPVTRIRSGLTFARRSPGPGETVSRAFRHIAAERVAVCKGGPWSQLSWETRPGVRAALRRGPSPTRRLPRQNKRYAAHPCGIRGGHVRAGRAPGSSAPRNQYLITAVRQPEGITEIVEGYAAGSGCTRSTVSPRASILANPDRDARLHYRGPEAGEGLEGEEPHLLIAERTPRT